MRKQKVYIAVVILLFFAIIGTAIFFIMKDKKIEITATYQDFTEKDIIYDQGYLYVDSQLLLTAEADSTYEEVEKMVKRYNAEIVGYISISNDYQIALPSGTEYVQLREIVDELNHDERVELCTLNYVYPMEESSGDYTKDPWIPASDPRNKSGSEWSEIKVQGANVKHFFTSLGKMFFTSYGKEFLHTMVNRSLHRKVSTFLHGMVNRLCHLLNFVDKDPGASVGRILLERNNTLHGGGSDPTWQL